MKKTLSVLAILIACAAISTAQQASAYFIKNTAPLDGSETVNDTVFVEQVDVMSIYPLPNGGSTINWQENFINKSANVREQIGDSAWTFASFSFTVTTNDTLYDVTVAGVSITDTVPKAGTATLTAAAIADSINALTSSPNYSATSLGAVVTITPTADSTATPNGRAVVVSSAGTATPSNGILEGGFYRRNISTIYGDKNTLIELNPIGLSYSILLNAYRIHSMTGNAPCQFLYSGYPYDTYRVDESRIDILTLINALP